MTVLELVRGRDGKLYEPRPVPRSEVVRRRWLAHQLICGRGLTYRQAQAAMLAEHAVRRSLGAICKDIRRYECPQCAGQPQAVPGNG